MEGEEESYGVGSAGDGDAEAVAGLDVFAREGQRGRHCLYVSWSEMACTPTLDAVSRPEALSVFLLFACGCKEGCLLCRCLDAVAEVLEEGRLGG